MKSILKYNMMRSEKSLAKMYEIVNFFGFYEGCGRKNEEIKLAT